MTFGGLALTGAVGSSLAQSDPYPERPVTLVVPFTPGGTTDVLARVVGENLGKRLGGSFLIDNKPGANTIIGAQLVAKARPDGYTMLIAAGSTMVLNPLLRKQLSYNPEREFDIIALTGDIPLVAVVPATSPIRNLDDLIARVKDKRTPLTYASVGVGSTLHLAGELFEDFTGSPMTHVAYKGSVPAITDVVGGRVDLMFDSPTTALPHVQSGKLRAIAVTSATRQSYLPDVPAVAEKIPNYLAIVWYGLVAPKGLPAAVRDKLKTAMDASLASPEYQTSLHRAYISPAPVLSPEKIAEFVGAERKRWGDLIGKLNIVYKNAQQIIFK
jgi:tripartite-type tricarboxylate transporter receptor subunit TctC